MAQKQIATNRRARHEFELIKQYECGLELKGSEVKSLREARVEIAEAYGRVIDDELWIISMHIPAYGPAGPTGGHEPDRNKKLLAHRREIHDIKTQLDQNQLTLIPLAIYFKHGKAKIEVSLAKRKLKHDKRAQKEESESKRRAIRAVRRSAGKQRENRKS